MFILFCLIYFMIAGYEGVRNGLVKQLISFILYCFSFLLALVSYARLSSFLELLIPYPSPSWHDAFAIYDSSVAFHLDQSFYDLLAFFIIFLLGWLGSKIILYIIEPANYFIFKPLIDGGGGAVLSILQAYFILFFFLFILSTMAAGPIQSFFSNSGLARAIVQHTPFFSNFFFNHWILN